MPRTGPGVVAWTDDALVVRLDPPWGSRRAAWTAALVGLVLAIAGLAALVHWFSSPIANGAAATVTIVGAFLAFFALADRRVVAHVDGEGVVLERRLPWGHRKLRTVLARFDEIDGWEIASWSGEDGVEHGLVLPCGRRRVTVLAGSPEFLEEAGAHVLALAARRRGAARAVR